MCENNAVVTRVCIQVYKIRNDSVSKLGDTMRMCDRTKG